MSSSKFRIFNKIYFHRFQENKELREKVSKLERGRGWLEVRFFNI